MGRKFVEILVRFCRLRLRGHRLYPSILWSVVSVHTDCSWKEKEGRRRPKVWEPQHWVSQHSRPGGGATGMRQVEGRVSWKERAAMDLHPDVGTGINLSETCVFTVVGLTVMGFLSSIFFWKFKIRVYVGVDSCRNVNALRIFFRILCWRGQL